LFGARPVVVVALRRHWIGLCHTSSRERSRTASSGAGLSGWSPLEAYYTIIRADFGCARLPSSDYRKPTAASCSSCLHRSWFRSFITSIDLALGLSSCYILEPGTIWYDRLCVDMLVNRLVSFGVLRLTSTRLPTRWTLSGSAGMTQDWMSLASLRRGMKMQTTFRFVACALPVCRCWSALVPFGRGREPTTFSTKITAE